MQKYLIFCYAKYLKIPLRYWLSEIVSKIKIKILRPLYLLYLLLLYLRYSPPLDVAETNMFSIELPPCSSVRLFEVLAVWKQKPQE